MDVDPKSGVRRAVGGERGEGEGTQRLSVPVED